MRLMGSGTIAPAHVAVAASLVLIPAVRPGVAAACPDAELQPTQSNLARVEAAIVCLLNVDREALERAPVTRDLRLERSAVRHTGDMTRRGYFAHTRKDGPTVLERIRRARYFAGARSGLYSENLGYGPPERATAASMHRAFSLSTSHRKTMLHGRFRNIGIGSTMIDAHPAFYPDYPAVVFTLDFGRRYEHPRRLCRRRAASAARTDPSGRALPPRRWCRRRSSR